MEALVVILLIWVIAQQFSLNEIKQDIRTIKTNGVNGVNAVNGLNDKISREVDVAKNDAAYPTNLHEKPQPTIPVEPAASEDIFAKDSKQPSITRTTQKLANQGKIDFETLFLGNIFNKIGAVALIIAVAIFIKLISPFLIFTPAMKTALGFLFGLVLITIAQFLNKDSLKNYAEVLMGTGFAALFITTYCSYSILHTLNLPVALAVATTILVFTYLIADKQKTVSMLTISLIGGYLTPLFIKSDATLFGYLLFLNAISLVFAYRNPSRGVINYINLPLTMIIALCEYHTNFSVIYPLILWGMYLAYDIVRPAQTSKQSTLSWLNYAVLTFFSVKLFHSNLQALGYLLGATSFIYAGLAYMFKKLNMINYKHYLYSFLINLWIMVYFLATDVQSICLWTVEAFLFTIFCHKTKFFGLNRWIGGIYLTIFAGILLARVNGDLCITDYYQTLFNPRMAIFLTPITALGASILLLRKSTITEEQKLANLFKFGFVTLLYMYITTELNAFISHGSNVAFTREITFSMMGILYSLNLKKLYQTTNMLILDFLSYTIGAISLVFLLATGYNYPIKSTEHYIPILNLRFCAFALAIAASEIFRRWTKENFFRYLTVFLGFILLHVECTDFIKAYPALKMNYLTSVLWVLYSGIVTTLGILKNKDYLKLSGIWLCCLTILRIFIYDLATVGAAYKLIAFFVLGVILMVISYFYAKNKNSTK